MRLSVKSISAIIFLAVFLTGFTACSCMPSRNVEFQSPYVEAEDGEWARVTKVVDGDTIYVEGDRKIRYIGVDTPETKHPSKGLEPYGPQATEANRKLVEGQTVLLVKDVSETDRYGRLLRYIFLPDGTFVNLKLVEDGYARVATFPPDVNFTDLFLEAERKARAESRGLWGLEDE